VISVEHNESEVRSMPVITHVHQKQIAWELAEKNYEISILAIGLVFTLIRKVH
jgi:hypothetical protein